MAILQKGDKKLLHAWAFYDWANSVYPLVISSAVFPIFYGALTIIKDTEGNKIDDTVNFLGIAFNNDSLISYVTALSFLVVSFISPILSGISDYVGNKENFMKFFCYMGSLACIGLYWFNLEHLWFGLLCYMLALIGFWGSLVFYNSYLPDIAFPEQQDKISAKGFSLGYTGSVLLLVVNLVMILKYEWFGFEDAGAPTRIAFILVGIWWMGFAQYTFKHLPTGTNEGHAVTRKVLMHGYNELKKIWHALKDNKVLRRYLTAFFVYSMAVQTIMIAATYFAVEELDWGKQDSTTGLIISILLIQLIAVVGAHLTARLSKLIGNIKSLIIIIFIWIAICAYAFFVYTPMQFYITAACVGMVMGGIQSLSRSTYSKLVPEQSEDTASYFSFYDVSEKIGIVIGMFLYGWIAGLTGSMRYSILFLITFFIIGLILLYRVPKTKLLV
ncbi:MAG: MFS transporter [Bacteroidia bacterium]|nr:MFS transporter [Bacteroidia bacterium]MBT8269308.1 MFS transporter [Bacteroidia bacterium]NNF82751.1 MFS transporter [Flavobacteriaceae bacterium]NNK69354.1 MFS transporter [Flavobacteriaceae bacterium]NNL79341.1 MFS transporter [Flavobacteriaceae bacterium]